MKLFYLQVDLWAEIRKIQKAYKMGYEFTEKQLKKWSVKYHKLIMENLVSMLL